MLYSLLFSSVCWKGNCILILQQLATKFYVFISMEEQQQHDGMRGKHRCKCCGHCDEVLSYSAYRAHKGLYYNEAEGKWRRCKGCYRNTSTAPTALRLRACLLTVLQIMSFRIRKYLKGLQSNLVLLMNPFSITSYSLIVLAKLVGYTVYYSKIKINHHTTIHSYYMAS